MKTLWGFFVLVLQLFCTSVANYVKIKREKIKVRTGRILDFTKSLMKLCF